MRLFRTSTRGYDGYESIFKTVQQEPPTVPISQLPDIVDADFSAMNAKELRLAQEEIWAWISVAESASFDDAPDDESLDAAHDALNDIIAERRALHGDETAPRGG